MSPAAHLRMSLRTDRGWGRGVGIGKDLGEQVSALIRVQFCDLAPAPAETHAHLQRLDQTGKEATLENRASRCPFG